MAKRFLLPVLLLSLTSFAAVDYNALGNDAWTFQALSGGVVSTAGDVHWACDTSGSAYIFGACSYGGQAGGTHNSDVYRFNLQSGKVELLSSCSNNKLGWTSGCQNGITFDPTRNVMWVDEIGGLSVCTQAYTGGFFKYQCPNGPLTKMAGGGGGTYLAYDAANDVVFQPADYTLKIYNCKTNAWKTPVNYPFSQPVNTWTIPTCVDSKRGLFVITLTGPYTITNAATQVVFDVWFYNAATNQWAKKTPPTHPNCYELELTYDEVHDKYVYFGQNTAGTASELWTYDYDSNAWTQIQTNGRAYNDANNAASTWPPARQKHSWAYSSKYNACVNWAGGVWSGSAYTDYDNGAQPIWIYRLPQAGTGIDASSLRLFGEQGFSVFPNPFSGHASLRLPAGDYSNFSVFDARGRLMITLTPGLSSVTDLNATEWPAGVYMARFAKGREIRTQPLMLIK